jgi:hypothetical protein
LFRPRGQTPLGYSLERVAEDFGGFQGERAVVLVTDGIESCGGDPVAAARALRAEQGIAVHVIGFGLGGEGDEHEESLRAIAEASGGRYVTARNAEELREALSVTVGTAFDVWQAGAPVASGALGSDEVISLPAGDYVVRLDATPAHEVAVTIASEESVTLVLERSGDHLLPDATRRPVAEYRSCQAGTAGIAPLVSISSSRAAIASQAEVPTPVPAAPAPTALSATAPGVPEPAHEARPQRSKQKSLAIDRGSVEVWQDTHPDREPWVVVVRHPEMKQGSVAVWKGDQAAVAEAVAEGVQQALRGLAPGDETQR